MRSKRQLLKRFLAMSLACVAAACSSMRSQQVGTLLDPYVGQPVSAIVDRFGPPSGHFASSTVATTYQWDAFGAQSGMTGCRVLVVASRTAQDANGAASMASYGSDPISPDEYWKWTINSWSSFGSGCH
jgi:hypothetical protein